MLFTPLKIKELTLKNRIVMSPMCVLLAEDDGLVTDRHLAHYGARALGQVGLIMVEATAIEPRGRITANDLGIWGDHQIEGLKRLVHMIHDGGAKAAIQIAHAGRKSKCNTQPVGPFAEAFDQTYATPKALSIEGIQQTIKLFVQAVKRASEAGFDVIELHGAHGYLINQFLSPLTNKRTDEYGGSITNRFRFLNEIISEVRSVYKGVLMLRISAMDHAEGGMQVADYIPLLKNLDVNLVDVSSGGVVADAKITVGPGYQVPYSEEIKKGTGKMTGAVGLINSAELANSILKNQAADLIFLARPLLRNPYWAIEAALNLHQDISLFGDIYWIKQIFRK